MVNFIVKNKFFKKQLEPFLVINSRYLNIRPMTCPHVLANWKQV